jgi:hypothetical protein
VVDVAMGESHCPGVGWTQAHVTYGLEDQRAVGGVSAVNEHEAGFVSDHDPVGSRSFNEKDAGCLLGNVG